jgi:8-oxo-dGTP diphosphatase
LRRKGEALKKIRKIGAIIQNDDRTKILVVKKAGKGTYIIPGGKPDPGETDIDTLHRELREELSVTVTSQKFFGEYVEPAEFEDAQLTMRVYEVTVAGRIRVDNEITNAIWVDHSYAAEGVSLGSTLRNHVIPQLRQLGRL